MEVSILVYLFGGWVTFLTFLTPLLIRVSFLSYSGFSSLSEGIAEGRYVSRAKFWIKLDRISFFSGFFSLISDFSTYAAFNLNFV